MALSSQQKKVLDEAKSKMKIMGQVARLEKEIVTFQKKLENKEEKMRELINTLSGEIDSNKKTASSISKKSDTLPFDAQVCEN